MADAIYTNRQGRFTDFLRISNTEHLASTSSSPPLHTGIPSISAALQITSVTQVRRSTRHYWHVSPLGWSHIGLTGDYLWEEASFCGGGEYRALHDPSGKSRLVIVAIARRLVTIANAILKTGVPWQPQVGA